MKISLIIPYYESPEMIQKQIETVLDYPEDYEIILIDDCSKRFPLIPEHDRIKYYRIDTDIPWNREGVRNLGATVAQHDMIMQIDTDHIFPKESAEDLLSLQLNKYSWYRFPRYRIGKADETRKKDTIPDDAEFGKIKPHIDSYLCSKLVYWEVGGYNENYSGCLGGGGPFLQRMKQVAGDPILLPNNVRLNVYTRDKIKDASVSDLSRDKTEFKKRRKMYGSKKAENHLRFEWYKLN